MSIKIDGSAYLKSIKESNFIERVNELREHGCEVSLATVLVGEDPASIRYVNSKHKDCEEVGIKSIRVELSANSTTAEVIEAVHKLNNDDSVTGYIVQLPLPEHIDQDSVLNSINPNKDADGLSAINMGELMRDIDGKFNYPVPCTPMGIIRLIRAFCGYNVFNGAEVCVIGRGATVGRVIGPMLTAKSVNATAVLCHTGTRNLEECIWNADIVISCAGSPDIIKPYMVRPEQILVDVGISRRFDSEKDKYVIAGDIDKRCYDKCKAYTPNPGGVGPMTRAMLLDNVISIAERKCCD